MIGLYIGGMVMGILSALIFKKTIFKGKPIPFVMELPAYRFPSAKNVILHMWEKAKDFIVKAFTVIFLANIVIWLLQTFDFRLNIVESSESMLSYIGKAVAVVFKPLGFGDWRAATALVTGLSAKEAVISTLAILTGVDASQSIASIPMLSAIFPTTASVLSFLTFTLLYMPCVAAFTAMRRELGKTRYAVMAMCYYTSFAWIASFIVFNISKLLF